MVKIHLGGAPPPEEQAVAPVACAEFKLDIRSETGVDCKNCGRPKAEHGDGPLSPPDSPKTQYSEEGFVGEIVVAENGRRPRVAAS